jgi:DNA repair protein RecN (Recombination protein N)
MLTELNIHNLAVIEDARIKLSPGLTIISGEEGSGKSLIVDALAVLLGARASTGLIRSGTSATRVEGVFWLSLPVIEKLKSILEETDVELDSEGTLIISRELLQQGRSIARINSRPVPLSLLRNIGQNLMDIHGQMDYISLLDNHHQLNLLDAHGNTVELRNKLSSTVDKLRQIIRDLSSPTTQKTDERQELIKYQIDEIERADLKPGEDKSLQERYDVLCCAEVLKESCLKAYDSLYGEERSATVLIHEALVSLKAIKNNDSAILNYRKQLEDATANMEETARELRNYGEKLEADSSQLEEIEQRIGLINSLRRKYGTTIEDILAFYSKANIESKAMENESEQKMELEKDRAKWELEAGKQAEELSLLRRRAATSLTELVNEELADLGLPWAKFDIGLQREEDSMGLPIARGKRFAFTREGIDHIDFMVATNPGEPVRQLSKIASGGETCRIMLALKSALKRIDPIPTLVFDEIDASVGGRSGDTMGRKLAMLARQHQVLCITHLPQIACFGDFHIKLLKDTSSGRAYTKVEQVEGQSRVQELAAMLGSAQAEKAMFEGAGKLLRKAQTWKEREKEPVAAG